MYLVEIQAIGMLIFNQKKGAVRYVWQLHALGYHTVDFTQPLYI